MTTTTEAATGARRLRTVHPFIDADGTCSLLYDLERTLTIEVPRGFRRGLERALASAAIDPRLSRWLIAEDLLTTAPRRNWAEGALPRVPPVRDVSLDMSGACNMGCAYCFEDDIGSRIGKMSTETALTALDFAFAQAAGAARIALHFGSGEPLLRFDLLQRLVTEAERRVAVSGQQITFELTTNASLVTPAIAGYLAAHPFNVRVSCDGPAHIHNRFRPLLGGQPSYAVVVRGLGRLLETMPARVTVNSVLAGKTRLTELWEWAKELGVKHFHVIKVGAHPGRALNLDEEDIGRFRGDLEGICDDLFADLRDGEVPLDYQPITKIVRRLMIPEPVTRFCGVAGSYLGVASDGKVYPCFRHLGLERYELGDVWHGVSDDKRQAFLGQEAASVDDRPICRDCWARYLCGGGCYADSTVYGPSKNEPQVQHCPYWRTEIELAIRFHRRLIQADPTYCLRLFGDDPEMALQAVSGAPRFVERRNCL